MSAKTAAMLGALFALLGVVLGAFGSHALKGILDDYSQGIYQTANHYQFVHSLGLLALAALWQQLDLDQRVRRLMALSAYLFTLGLVLFCGSLYLLSLTQIKVLGAITPLGGTAFIAAWACMIWGLKRAHWPSNSTRES